MCAEESQFLPPFTVCLNILVLCFFVGSSSELVVHYTGNASRSIPCPSSVTREMHARPRIVEQLPCNSNLETGTFENHGQRQQLFLRCRKLNYRGCWLGQELQSGCYDARVHEKHTHGPSVHVFFLFTCVLRFYVRVHMCVYETLRYVPIHTHTSSHISATCAHQQKCL